MDGLKWKGVWVQALGFLPDSEVLQGFPISVGSNGAQGEHGLGSGDFPTHAAAFHAVAVFHSVFGQVTAGSFDHAGGDRATRGQVVAVLHAVQVGFQEPGQCAELDLGRAGESSLRALTAEIGDDRLGLSLQDTRQAASDERNGFGAGFLVEQMRRVPQAWQDVQQVENVDGLCVAREVFVAVGLQRDLAVAQMNQRLARLAAEGDVIAEMLEDFRLAADLDRSRVATPTARTSTVRDRLAQ